MTAGLARERPGRPLPKASAGYRHESSEVDGVEGVHPLTGRFNFLDDEFLPVAEVARRLSVSEKTARRRMRDGTWQKGVVWFQPPLTQPRLSWKAVVAWQRGEC